MSTLELYEYPSHDTSHEPHDEKDSETSSDARLCPTNGQVAMSDEQRAKRELSAIKEDNEDSTQGGQDMEDNFPKLCSESSETQDWSFPELPCYVMEAHNRPQHKSLPNSKYDLDVDHAFMEDKKQSHRFCVSMKKSASEGYIKHSLMPYPSINPLHVPASSEGIFQVSPNGYAEKSARNDVVSVTGEVVKTDVSACDEYTAKLTMLEPNSFAGVLSATSDGSVQTSPHQTQEKEQYPISELSAYTLFQLGKCSTHPKTAPKDDSIPTNCGTASSGNARYKSCVQLTSSYGTPTSVDPCSCRNTGNCSLTSSGYVSESSTSMYKHGSSANPSRNILEMSGYVTESLEPVPTLSLSKHSIIHSKVSIEPSLSTATHNACVDDDQLAGQPSITPDHLHSEGCNADSRMIPSGYVPTQHPSTPTASPITSTCDPPTFIDETSTPKDVPSTPTDNPLTITYDPSSLADDPSPALTDDPSTLTDDPSTPTDDPSTLTDDPSTLTDDPSALTDDPSTHTDDLSILTDDPSTHTDDPSTLTDDPFMITNDLALECGLYNIQTNDSSDSRAGGATHNTNVMVLPTGKEICGSTLHDTASKLNPHLYIRDAPYNDPMYDDVHMHFDGSIELQSNDSSLICESINLSYVTESVVDPSKQRMTPQEQN